MLTYIRVNVGYWGDAGRTEHKKAPENEKSLKIRDFGEGVNVVIVDLKIETTKFTKTPIQYNFWLGETCGKHTLLTI